MKRWVDDPEAVTTRRENMVRKDLSQSWEDSIEMLCLEWRKVAKSSLEKRVRFTKCDLIHLVTGAFICDWIDLLASRFAGRTIGPGQWSG